MSTLQFKRVLDYDGTIEKAIENVNNHVRLKDGEPLLCSYSEDGKSGSRKFFLAIGVKGNVKIFPSFDNMAEVVSFIQSNATVNLENTSEDSDITITMNEENKYVFKLKDELKSNNI